MTTDRCQRAPAGRPGDLRLPSRHAVGGASRAELRATGEFPRRRSPSPTQQLTPQEVQVARLVAGGLPTREVAAHLFLSPRTIDFHLHNIFTKTGITSRTELAHLPLA